MENKKLISLRLNPQVLEKIDKITYSNEYWNRTAVISSILDAVFDCFDKKAINDMMRYHHRIFPNSKGSFYLEKSNSSPLPNNLDD